MGFRFVGQPFPDGEQLGRTLSAALRNEAGNAAWFATAWGKQSGLSRLAPAIAAFRDHGGYVEVILGVDEGGATKEGLQLALELFDAVHIFYDPGVRTFHPKVYVAQSDTEADVVIGSGNLTAGGLYTNFEGNVAANLDLTDEADTAFLADVRAFYNHLLALDAFCKPLTEQLIADLEADPRIVLLPERQANRRRAGKRGHDGSRVFGAAAIPDLLGAPPPGVSTSPRTDGEDDAIVGGDAPGTTVGTSLAAVPVVRWWKKLTASDAHRKPARSHQRNYVALSQAGRPIDPKSWFRTQFFGTHVAWSNQPMRTGSIKEVAVVPFDVYIQDDFRARYNLTIDHAENRIANQNNTPTYLNWSGLLPMLLATDYEGWWMELARLSDGGFLLRLSSEEPSA